MISLPAGGASAGAADGAAGAGTGAGAGAGSSGAAPTHQAERYAIMLKKYLAEVEEFTTLLKSYLARPDIETYYDQRFVEILNANPALANEILDNKGNTALHLAAEKNALALCLDLLGAMNKKGIKNHVNLDGKTACDLATDIRLKNRIKQAFNVTKK